MEALQSINNRSYSVLRTFDLCRTMELSITNIQLPELCDLIIEFVLADSSTSLTPLPHYLVPH